LQYAAVSSFCVPHCGQYIQSSDLELQQILKKMTKQHKTEPSSMIVDEAPVPTGVSRIIALIGDRRGCIFEKNKQVSPPARLRNRQVLFRDKSDGSGEPTRSYDGVRTAMLK
jgi:hypothetical protein